MNKISVIVPIYNALDEVKALLNSLIENFNFYLGEIILINDCSNKDTSDYLKEFANSNPNFTLINNEVNLGFVKTCNKGIKTAKGEIIVLLNSDTIIPSEFCERIIKCFNSDDKIGTASPISSFSARYFINLPKNMTLEQMNSRLRESHKCSYPFIPDSEGFCFCIRKKLVEQQGYLDEIYDKGYCEETDFSHRAVINGWKNVLIDDLYVYHKRCCSFGEDDRKKLMEQNSPIYKSRWKIFKRMYYRESSWQNPIIKIKKEIFKNRFFYIGKSVNKKILFVNILGLKFKFKK